MGKYPNFNRSYRVAAGKAGQQGFEVGADGPGQPIPLHVDFSFEKSDLTSQNNGKITLWNLNPQQLAVLNQKDCVLSVRAGYGDHLNLIFAGVVTVATTTMDEADRKTEIEVVDNLIQIRDTYISVAYKGKVNWKTIMDDVAAQMGVAVTYSYNAKFTDVENGYSFVGQAKKVMDKGCACCGLTWSLQNGVMQVKKPGDTMSQEVFVLNEKTGLLGVPAKVMINEDQTNGKAASTGSAANLTGGAETPDATNTSVKEIMNEIMTTGTTKAIADTDTTSTTTGSKSSKVSSTSQKKTIEGWDVEYFMNAAITVNDYVKLESKTITGYFRVQSVTIEGDNISGDWVCKARLLEVKPS